MLFTPLLQGGASSGSTTTKLVCVNSTRKYNRQPQVTAQIDPYWKARGFKWVVNGTQPRELISGDILSPTAGATTEVNQSGKALANRSTGVGWTKSITSSPSQAATLVWFGDFYASSTIDPFLAGIIPNLTDSAPYSNVALIRNRTGFGAGSIGFFYADATNTLKIDCSPNFVYNTTKNLGIVAKIRNGSQKLFTNIRGLEKETTYILGGGGLRTATPILVVGSGHVGRSADASCSLFAVSDQFLTDEECLSLAKNPWQIFKAPSQSLYLASVNSTVSPTLFTNTNNYYNPTIGVGVVNITNTVLPSTTSFFVATVSTGSITLLDPLYTNSNTLVAPTVTTGVVLLSATLYTNATILYTAIVANYVWQASIIIFLSGLRTKVFNTLNKSMLLLSSTRTKIFTMGIKTLSLTSATRTKVFIPANKSISLTSATRTYTFVIGIKTKIFPTSTRG